MFQRLQKAFLHVQQGVNAGWLLGIGYIFLTLIGVPSETGLSSAGGDETAEAVGLAGLAVPLYLLIAFIVGWYLSRHIEESQIRRLVFNTIAAGAVASVVFLFFMGIINSWHAEGRIDVRRQYFNQMDQYPVYVLSGVPLEELHANPQPDPVTGEYAPDAEFRTNPMQLYLEDQYAVFSLPGGLFHLGGLYGLGVAITLLAAVGGLAGNGFHRVDWPEARANFIKQVNTHPLEYQIKVIFHYLILTTPFFIFLMFWVTVPQSTDIGFFESLGLATEQAEPIINLETAFNLTSDSLITARSIQLGLSFMMIIMGMVSFQYANADVTALSYPARLGILYSIIVLFGLLGFWRIASNDITFILPSSGFRLGGFMDAENWTYLALLVALIGSAVYITIAGKHPERFQYIYSGLLAMGVILISPLYMNEDLTFTMVRVTRLIMFGLGMNIVIGYAGLLDLGYVAFYAIGAYFFAFVAYSSDQFKLASVSHHNDLGWSIALSVVLAPILISTILYFWRDYRTRNPVPVEDDGLESEILDKHPVWDQSPPLPVMLSTLVITVLFVFIAQWVLQSIGLLSVTLFSSFLIAIVVALMAGGFAGIALGFPVLRLRGDYLAIVTLGFGEIISLALENLKDITGGPQGALDIPKPFASASVLSANMVFLYLSFAGALLVFLVSLRLRQSRIGRAWMAIRGDEDIAQAMGINLVNLKLLAFSIGASFAGLAGMLFASRQSNIGPADFTLQISIDVLSLVIIGGMGSLPGVVVGAIVLVGLPEMLRPIREYRILLFGLLLIITMVSRPGGLMPAPPPALEDEARRLAEEAEEKEKGKDD